VLKRGHLKTEFGPVTVTWEIIIRAENRIEFLDLAKEHSEMPAAMTDTVDGLPVPQRYWAILTIALGLIMAVMDGAIANVALPTIAQDLHASPAFSIWIVNGYQLAITISLLPGRFCLRSTSRSASRRC
jgi:hypothetical protein